MHTRLATAVAIALLSYGAAAQTNAPGQHSSRPQTWAVQLIRPGLTNFYQVTTNVYRGAQPSARGMAELKAMGIKTVVNLRTFHSDRGELSGTGLKPAHLHMRPWNAESEDIVGFLKIVSDTNNLPVYVHCQRGADRTGLVCAMYRIAVCGWKKEDAIQEMTEGGFKFYPGWKNLVRYIERADIEKLKRRAGISSKK